MSIPVTYVFHVTDPIREVDGQWWFEVRGQRTVRYGPCDDEAHARRVQHATFCRYVDRANTRGGYAQRRTDQEWLVTLPVGVACSGLPFRPEAISNHGRMPR